MDPYHARAIIISGLEDISGTMDDVFIDSESNPLEENRMRLTKTKLQQIIKEEYNSILEGEDWGFGGQPALEYNKDSGDVYLKTSEGEFRISPEDLVNMKSPEWDDDVIEIETPDMGGKSVDLPKEYVEKFIEKLRKAI